MHACFKIQWILVQENIQNQILRKSTPLIKLGTQSKTKTKFKKKKREKKNTESDYKLWEKLMKLKWKKIK